MVSTFMWRLRGDDDPRGEKAHDLETYRVAVQEHGIEILCPECKEWRQSRFKSKLDAMRNGNPHEREQFISGLCSNDCWNKHLGLDDVDVS